MIEVMDKLTTWWPLLAIAATAAFTLLVVRLRTVFATRTELDATRLRIEALEKHNIGRQHLLEKALADFDKRTDALAGKNELAECLKEVTAAHHRVDLLELVVKALPGASKIDGLVEKVASMVGDLRAMAEKVNGLDDKVDTAVAGVKRVEDWLQESKR